MIFSSLHSLRPRWANLHLFVRLLVLLAVAVVIGLIVASGPYQKFRSWRMGRNLLAARDAVGDVRMQEARDLSLTVLRTDESCVEAFRILEKATASLRDSWHSEIARALLAHPDASDEDRLTAFRGIAPEVPLGLLKQAWTMLPTQCREDLRFVTVFADRMIAERRFKEATLVLLAVPAAARTPAVDQRLIRILIGSGKQEGYDEAQRLLAGSIPTSGQELADWLSLLEEIPLENLRINLLEPVRKVLESPASGASPRGALMRARLDYAFDPARRPAILEDAIHCWKDREPEALAGFLGNLRLDQLLLETIPAERVLAHPGLLPRLLEASERSGAWPRTFKLLNAHGLRMPKFEELAHRAVMAANTGDSATFLLAWTNARGEAKISPVPGAFLKLHRIAREAAMDKEATQAMVDAIQCGRGPLPLYADLKPLLTELAQQGQDKTLLKICATYLPFESANPVLITQLAYLASLSQLVDTKAVVAAMEHLAEGFPKEVPIQCVLATAYLCDNQPTAAAATLDRLKLDPAQLSAGYQAALLTTQVLNRRVAKDDPSVTGLPWQALLPSERKRFGDLIRTTDPNAANAETLENR